MKPKAKAIRLPKRIHHTQLCTLVGLTDQRLRQLADKGHFEQPDNGWYKFKETITAISKYHREIVERGKQQHARIDAEKERKLKLENDQTEKQLTDTQALVESISPMLASFRDLVYIKFEIDAPRDMAGIDVPTARIIGRRLAAELLKKLQDIFRAMKV